MTTGGLARDSGVPPGSGVSVQALAHPGWFGGVMGTAALARVLVSADLGPGQAVAGAASWVLLVLAGMLFAAALTVTGMSLRRDSERLRDRVVSPLRGPLYAAIPGSVFTLLLAFLAHEPQALLAPGFRALVLVVVMVTLAAGFWLTITFFVAAFEHENFAAASISGTWFLPETVILLGVLLLSQLTVSEPEEMRAAMAAATIAVMGAGFVLFILTAGLFFTRLVLIQQEHDAGVAAIWIMMSPLSVSSLAFGAAGAVLPTITDIPAATVVALVSLGSGMLWGFGLWWLLAALMVTFHQGGRAIEFSPGSWAYVFPLGAISLASADLALIWDSRLVAGIGIALLVLTSVMWAWVAGTAVRWVLRRSWLDGDPSIGTVA